MNPTTTAITLLQDHVQALHAVLDASHHDPVPVPRRVLQSWLATLESAVLLLDEPGLGGAGWLLAGVGLTGGLVGLALGLLLGA